jgi:hypothetical protein
MKNPWYAFALSLIVPGAGLAYCHKWTWAVGNLALVTLAIAAVVFFFPDSVVYNHIHYLIVALAAGSAGFAHAVATQWINDRSPK